MLALSWYQPRLKYLYNVEFFEIDSENMKKLWVPDLYFPNEKLASFHQIMGPNTMMRLYPDGRLEYLARSDMLGSLLLNLQGQSNKVPPTYNSDLPTVVQCQVYVDSFDSVSEASMFVSDILATGGTV